MLDQINTKQDAKLMDTFDFRALFTKLPHRDLLDVLLDLIGFVFDGGSKKEIDFSLKNAFLSNKPKSLFFPLKPL